MKFADQIFMIIGMSVFCPVFSFLFKSTVLLLYGSNQISFKVSALEFGETDSMANESVSYFGVRRDCHPENAYAFLFIPRELCWTTFCLWWNMPFFRRPIKVGGCKQGAVTFPRSCTQRLLLHLVFLSTFCTFNYFREVFEL